MPTLLYELVQGVQREEVPDWVCLQEEEDPIGFVMDGDACEIFRCVFENSKFSMIDAAVRQMFINRVLEKERQEKGSGKESRSNHGNLYPGAFNVFWADGRTTAREEEADGAKKNENVCYGVCEEVLREKGYVCSEGGVHVQDATGTGRQSSSK